MHLFAAYVTSAIIILLRPFLKLSPLPITLKYFSITQGMVSYAVKKKIFRDTQLFSKFEGKPINFQGCFVEGLLK